MKKLVQWVAVLTAMMMLVACVPLTALAESQDQVTLTLWSIWSSDSESNKAPFLKTLDEFQAAYPNIKVELDMSEAEAYKTKIKTAVAANEAPDVFYYNAGGMLKSFVDAGKVLALNDYVDEATMGRIVEGTLANMTFDGKIYGLPYTLACSVLFCNTELFEKYNVKIPETWTELMTAVKTFKDAGLVPMALGGKDRWPTCMYTDLITLRAAGYQECADTFNKTANASFVTDGMKLAAEKYNELIDELEPKIAEGKAKLKELADTADDAWDDVKEGAASIWDQMKSTFSKVADRFDKDDEPEVTAEPDVTEEPKA